VLSPGMWTYARSEIAACVKQIAFHQPERKSEVLRWFSEVFRFIAAASVEDNIIDSDFLGLAVWDALELRAPELLPDIKKLFDLGYVSEGICGEYQNVELDIKEPVCDRDKKELLNIFNRYTKIISTWAGYKDEPDDMTYEKEEKEEPYRAGLKIGRNDPCPCGSGKKFKKCCMEKCK